MLSQSIPVQNLLLAHLPAHVFDALRPRFQRVQLKRNHVLQGPHRQVRHAYFIESGVAAMFADTNHNRLIEVGIVGRFGFIGIPIVLGTMLSTHRCVMEVEGEALQITSKDLKRAMEEQPALRQQLMNYVQALLIQSSQTIVCNGLHHIEERLARWLLLAHDRLDGNNIPLTHDLLSMMLGVRRAGVTTALAELESIGAVRRRHGVVEITNRTLLEQNVLNEDRFQGFLCPKFRRADFFQAGSVPI
jgi:CRP-like cAMP-binding protein